MRILSKPGPKDPQRESYPSPSPKSLNENPIHMQLTSQPILVLNLHWKPQGAITTGAETYHMRMPRLMGRDRMGRGRVSGEGRQLYGWGEKVTRPG